MKKKPTPTAQLPGWSPFKEYPPEPLPSDREIARQAKLANVTFDEMKRVLEDIQKDTVLVNSRYQVNMRLYEPQGFPKVFSLSIKRRDKQRVGPERYRDFLRIKNELVGPMHEGFEIYPRMDRNVDTANQYYIWVFATPGMRLPVGFMDGRMSVPEDEGKTYGVPINTPFDEGDLEYQHMGTLTQKGK